MPRYNLPRVYTVTDEKGNPQGFGPGECDVPEWAVKQLKARGRDIESYRAKSGVSPASETSTGNAITGKAPEKA
jgi:hypothetical protein